MNLFRQCLIVLPLVLTVSVGLAQEVRSKNEIIRELAPVKYLPEHGGEQPAIDLDIRFAFNSATLSDDALGQLGQLGEALGSDDLSGLRFDVAGHTDAAGDADYNMTLSLNRAATVVQYLIKNYNIAEDRLKAVGWGEERLKDKLDPLSGKNRRVEIIAYDNDGGDGPPRDVKIDW